MRGKQWLAITMLGTLWLCPAGGQQVEKASGQLPSIRAAAAIVINAQNGAILFARNPDKRLPPASTTKIMTGWLFARLVPPQKPVTVSPDAAHTSGSTLGMKPGETFAACDLLHALLLVSANDASVAAAEAASGTTAKFVAQMNAEAKRVGAPNTHFSNPHGLPAPDHYATARDLATIARAALQNPDFAAVVRTRTYRVPRVAGQSPTLLTNTNDLLWTLPGADGVKTGWTHEAGRCFVGSASIGGRRIITVVLDSPDWQNETAALLRYGFARLAPQTVVSSPKQSTPDSAVHPAGTLPAGASGTPAASSNFALPNRLLQPEETVQNGLPSHPDGQIGQGLRKPDGAGKPQSKGTFLPARKSTATKSVPALSTHQTTASRGGESETIVHRLRAAGSPDAMSRFSWWWLLWLLLLLLAAWCAWRLFMNAKFSPFALLRRRDRQQEQEPAPPVETVTPAPRPMPAPDFAFAVPEIERRDAPSWLESVLDSPRLLEPAVRRQAAAVREAHPNACTEKLESFLDDSSVRVRVAGAGLLAPQMPLRAERALKTALDDSQTPDEVQAEAVEALAHSGGDRHETLWTQMVLRETSLPAARALVGLPALTANTRDSLKRALLTPETPDLRAKTLAGLAACILAAHDELEPEKAAPHLEALPSDQKDNMVTTLLQDASCSWADAQLVEAVLHGGSYPALQALMQRSPDRVWTELAARNEEGDETVRRAEILRWLVLGEGDVKRVRQFADAGDSLASGALRLGQTHRASLSSASPDALLAASLITSLRLGFSRHAPETIHAAFRTTAEDHSVPNLTDAPELEPLARAYARPEVRDAVQTTLHAEDGLDTLLAALTALPPSPRVLRELAFWSDKVETPTRLQIARTLSGNPGPESRAALSALAADPAPLVRAAALRYLRAHPERVCGSATKTPRLEAVALNPAA